MLGKLKEFDFYRKIPRDLTEATSHGSMLSICCALFMLTLFVAELWAYLSTSYVSNVVIDPVADTLLRINFNITVLDLPCEFAVIDVVDVLGTRTDNVTKNINKWQIDEAGIRRNYEGRNWDQPDLNHDSHHDLPALLANGVHATAVSAESFQPWLKSHKYVFVNYYAPWCIWCQRLEPVWEAFAEHADRDLPALGQSISIIKVDCVENRDLCMNEKVMAFPTLRLFLNGEPSLPEYRGDRTVDALMDFVKSRVAVDTQVEAMDPVTREAHEVRKENMRTDHPGCLMSGFLLVNRVPGHFHIEARSKFHNLNPAGSNMSHVVHQLSFGPTLSRNALRRVEEVPDTFFSMASTKPMDDKKYINTQLHSSYHHYIKVVSTHLEVGARFTGKDAILAYQMVESSQLMSYNTEDVPEARFSYDLSPMSVTITRKGKRFYEFLTSVCAIIGGTFTVVSLFNSFLGILFKAKRV